MGRICNLQMTDFDSNPFFVLSRPERERQELFESLVQADAIDKIMQWFKQRGRTITPEEAYVLIPQVISTSHIPRP